MGKCLNAIAGEGARPIFDRDDIKAVPGPSEERKASKSPSKTDRRRHDRDRERSNRDQRGGSRDRHREHSRPREKRFLIDTRYLKRRPQSSSRSHRRTRSRSRSADRWDRRNRDRHPRTLSDDPYEMVPMIVPMRPIRPVYGPMIHYPPPRPYLPPMRMPMVHMVRPFPRMRMYYPRPRMIPPHRHHLGQ